MMVELKQQALCYGDAAFQERISFPGAVDSSVRFLERTGLQMDPLSPAFLALDEFDFEFKWQATANNLAGFGDTLIRTARSHIFRQIHGC